MSQTETGKVEAAEGRTEEAKSFVRRVNAATRQKHTSEEKTRIVLEGFRREVTVNELCRREGIKPHSYYAWTKEFTESAQDYMSRTNLSVKVLDFVQLGGLSFLRPFNMSFSFLTAIAALSLGAGLSLSHLSSYPSLSQTRFRGNRE